MSSPSWSEQLRQSLKRLPTERPPRVAILGVGHELNGDDGGRPAVARALEERLAGQDRLQVIEGGYRPGKPDGAVRAFGPDLVLIVDAAQMGAAPGTVRLVPWQATTGLSASTHTLPLHILANFLTHELGCDVALLWPPPVHNRVDCAAVGCHADRRRPGRGRSRRDSLSLTAGPPPGRPASAAARFRAGAVAPDTGRDRSGRSEPRRAHPLCPPR